MYQHVCQGAECPYCSPFRPAYLARLDREAAVVHATLGHPGLRGEGRPADTKDHRLDRWVDGRGEPVRQWPKGPYPRPSTTIIIVGHDWREGAPWQVLCLQRKDSGWWGFPGGGQELGESLGECALRETREETGLLVHLYGAVCQDSDPMHGACCAYEDGVVQYANTTFLAVVERGVLVLSAESTQGGWYSTDELPQPFLASHRWRLNQALGHHRIFFPIR